MFPVCTRQRLFESIITPEDLTLITVRRDRLAVSNGDIENEWRWVYALQLKQAVAFTLEKREVERLAWKPLKTVQAEIANPARQAVYVLQGAAYFKEVFGAIEKLALGKLRK